MNILLLATAWGPKFGGINAFNRDFAVGLARELGAEGRVLCAAPNASPDDERDASDQGVTLVALNGKAHTEAFDTGWSDEALRVIRERFGVNTIDLWVGHDVVGGPAAVRGSEVSGGSLALINHMSYLRYQGLKHDSGSEAEGKHKVQRSLFGRQAHCFAVGPLLRDACQEMAAVPVTRLVPGFPRVGANRSPNNRVDALPLFETNLTIRRRLADSNKEDADAQYWLFIAYWRRAQAVEAIPSRLPEAVEAWKSAKLIIDGLAAMNRLKPQQVQYVAETKRRLAAAQAKMKKH